MSEAWIALIGTAFGGAGLKIVEQFLGRKKAKDDTAREIRDELRLELNDCRKERDEIEEEADVWRSRYYSLVSCLTTGDLQGALRKIQENAKES